MTFSRFFARFFFGGRFFLFDFVLKLFRPAKPIALLLFLFAVVCIACAIFLDKRVEVSKRIREKYNDRIPVIVEKVSELCTNCENA